MLDLLLSLHSFLIHLLLLIKLYLLLKLQIVLSLFICLYIDLLWFRRLNLLRIQIYLLFLFLGFNHLLFKPLSPVLTLCWYFVYCCDLICSFVHQLIHKLICHRPFLILLLIIVLLLPLLLIQFFLPQLHLLNTLVLVLTKLIKKVLWLRLWLPSHLYSIRSSNNCLLRRIIIEL